MYILVGLIDCPGVFIFAFLSWTIVILRAGEVTGGVSAWVWPLCLLPGDIPNIVLQPLLDEWEARLGLGVFPAHSALLGLEWT